MLNTQGCPWREKGCTSQGLNARLDTKGAIELGGYATVRVVPLEL